MSMGTAVERASQSDAGAGDAWRLFKDFRIQEPAQKTKLDTSALKQALVSEPEMCTQLLSF